MSYMLSLMSCFDLDVISLSLFEFLTRERCCLQTGQEKPVFKEELVYRGNLLEQHRSKMEGSKRLGLAPRNSESEEAILAVRKEIEEL